jgi:hypothetical protein
MNFHVYQDLAELQQFAELAIKLKVKRYLEIGCRKGGTFAKIMLVTGAEYGLAIDLPESQETKDELTAVANFVHSATGAAIDVIFGDSQNSEVVDLARTKGPFDLALIDADHRYVGVMNDWDNYHHLAPVIAIHDIAAPEGHISDGHINECGRFWRELKEGKRTEEFITPGSCMGFGIVYL